MRKMFIMRGAPGSGKSTLIHTLGADSYAVGRDDARAFLNGQHMAFEDGEQILVNIAPASQEPLVSRLVQDSVTSRMGQGETIFLDITASRPSDINQWRQLAKRFAYELVVVDCQGDLTDEDLFERNRNREPHKRVSEPIIAATAEKIRTVAPPKDIRVIPGTLEALTAELTTKVQDYNSFNRLIVVGDLQGCATALVDLLESVDYDADNGDRLILLGDIFDRGIENAEVFKLLNGLEFDFISGNHDRNMQYLLNGAFSSGFKSTRASLDEILASGVSKGDISRLLGKSSLLKVITFGDKEIWLTHGGVIDLGLATDDGYLTGLLPAQNLWYGVGGRDKACLNRGDYGFDVDKEFTERASQPGRENIWQFHGHRNIQGQKFASYSHSVSLESEVEFDGGSLSAVIVTKDDAGVSAFSPIQVKNTVTAGEPEWKSAPKQQQRKSRKAPAQSLQDRLRATPSEVITERHITEHDVYAYNFTRTAFNDGLWDPDVVRARGLFISPEGAVVQRGYDKFFNVGERPETELPSVMAALGNGDPVTVKHKLNGYLGLVSTQGSGELRCYSKAGPSLYADEFERLLIEHLTSVGKVDEFTDWLQRKRVTLSFEVLSPADPHIVSDGLGVVLLDALANAERMVLLDKVADEAAELFGFRRPKTEVISGEKEVLAAIEAARASDTEGAVFRNNATGYMVKVKSDSYSSWKRLRSSLNNAIDKDRKSLHSVNVEPREDEERALLNDITRKVGFVLTQFLTVTVAGSLTVDIPRLRAALESE